MATLDLLPSTTYRPPSAGQGHRRRRSLNTIPEDDEESNRGSHVDRRGRDRSSKNSSPTTRSPKNRSPKKADWLSPLSDHFPTPRGNHFMCAPIPYSSESSDSENDSPAPSSAPWTRNSYSTDATEFDDLYDVSSDEEDRRKAALRKNRGRQAKTDRSEGTTAGSKAALLTLVIPSGGDPWPGITNFKAMTSPSSFKIGRAHV